AHPLQVHIKESVRPGQQACRFWRGMLAQLDNRRHGGYEEQHSEKGRKSSAKSHFAMGKNDSRWRGVCGSVSRAVYPCTPISICDNFYDCPVEEKGISVRVGAWAQI